MNTSTRTTARTIWVAVRAMAVITVGCGIAYPTVITGVGQLVAPAQANGSLLRTADGDVVGSALIGQGFVDQAGIPLPAYFQPRPSAAGAGWDGNASSGSNWGPENADLIAAIRERRVQVAAFNGVAESAVPPDAVTASGSGLDPAISPEYAAIQVARVAAARGMSVERVEALVDAHTGGRDLGYLGEPRVNLVALNLALDASEG